MTRLTAEQTLERFAVWLAQYGQRYTRDRYVLSDDAQRAIDTAESHAEDRAEWAGYATPRERDEAADRYFDEEMS